MERGQTNTVVGGGGDCLELVVAVGNKSFLCFLLETSEKLGRMFLRIVHLGEEGEGFVTGAGSPWLILPRGCVPGCE